MLSLSRSSAIFVALVALAFEGGCGSERPRGTTDVPPELTFEGLTYRVYRGAVLTAEGDAVRAAFRRDTSDLTAEQVRVRFPAAAGRPEARIAARQGTGNLRQRHFLATGGVRAEQGDEVAVTEEARYSAVDGLVHGERPIEVHGGSRLVVRGPAFALDPREQRLTILGGAHILTEGGR